MSGRMIIFAVTVTLVVGATAQAQVGTDRLITYLQKQPYRVVFWFSIAQGNPCDVSYPGHFQAVRVSNTPSEEPGSDAALLRSTLQTKDTIVYYYVPASGDSTAEFTGPDCKQIVPMTTHQPLAPSREEASRLQTNIDTSTAFLSRYNRLSAQEAKTRVGATSWLASFAFFLVSATIVANNRDNLYGDVTILTVGTVVGGAVSVYSNLSRRGRHDAIARELHTMEAQVRLRF